MINQPDTPYLAPPVSGERPIDYADRMGRFYAAGVHTTHRKTMGQYMTPPLVGGLMAEFLRPFGKSVRILDPGAGAGLLTCAACERITQAASERTAIHVDAYELDPGLAAVLQKVLSYLADWVGDRGHTLSWNVRTDDFILANGAILGGSRLLFAEDDQAPEYDLAIGNPPYLKIPKSDPRARIASSVVHGQPNLYALFMAVSASLLKPGGQMVFITPRSFASGPYFRLFREVFFSRMRPTLVHVFESRTDTFERDSVLQENVIVSATRNDGWAKELSNEPVVVSSCNGIGDLGRRVERSVPVSAALDLQGRQRTLSIPTGEEADAVRGLVASWSGSLEAYGWRISTGPIVAFRAADLLESDPEPGDAPLLWMQNIRAMEVVWPIVGCRKPQYIKQAARARSLLLPSGNYVLMRRFSSKEQHKRLTAVPLLAGEVPGSWWGLENHLNYVCCPSGELTPDEAWGLAALYNSSLLDKYFRYTSGNTQVSATELRAMPLPPLETIVELGRLARTAPDPLGVAESFVANVLNMDCNREIEEAVLA